MARNLQQSRALQKRAEQLIPGGVNSPVRAFRSVGSDPPFLVRGEGAHVWDADGNRYIDYVGSWGPLILGHSNPEVLEAIIQAARNGTSFGASTPTEADLAALVIGGISRRREGALRQLRDRSHHVGHSPGARRHPAQDHRQVRRLLSRPQRRAAGEGGLGRRHPRHSRIGGRSGGVCRVHAGAAVQRSRAPSRRPSPSSRARSPA